MSTQLPLPKQNGYDSYLLGAALALFPLCAIAVVASTPRTASAWPIGHTTDRVCPPHTHPMLVAGGDATCDATGVKQWYVICRPTAEVCASLDNAP